MYDAWSLIFNQDYLQLTGNRKKNAKILQIVDIILLLEHMNSWKRDIVFIRKSRFQRQEDTTKTFNYNFPKLKCKCFK